MNIFSYDTIIFVLPALIIALSFHEFAHAYAADRLGDPTPRFQGRVTIDVRKHIDPWGAIMLLLTGFGWGKPVETNLGYLKNPIRDTAIISAAGPLANIIIALITIVIAAKVPMSDNLAKLFIWIFNINAGLAVFNLIPIPPLDGSKIVSIFMSTKTYYKYMEFQYVYQMQIMIGLMALIFFTDILELPLTYCIGLLYSLGIFIAKILPF